MTAAENSNFISHVNASDAKLTSVEKAAYAVLVIQHSEESVSLAGRRSTERDVVAYQSCPDQCVCILYPSLAATHDMCLPLGSGIPQAAMLCRALGWAGICQSACGARSQPRARVPNHVRWRRVVRAPEPPAFCARSRCRAGACSVRARVSTPLLPFLLVCCDYT